MRQGSRTPGRLLGALLLAVGSPGLAATDIEQRSRALERAREAVVGLRVQAVDGARSARTLGNLPGAGEAVVLHIETYVREDMIRLYGFQSPLEREWFRLLQSVQGVGAKASMAILGTLGPEGVGRAIALGDWNAVKAAPGVGPGASQQQSRRGPQCCKEPACSCAPPGAMI